MKEFFKNYCQFSKKERLGVVVLVALIGLFILLPQLYQPPVKKVYTDTILNQINQQVPVQFVDSSKFQTANENTIKQFRLFSFDPNIATAAEFAALGLSEKNIRTIDNYRSKGGRFRHATDLRKIWGIRNEDLERLIPYAIIEPLHPSYKKNIEQYNARNYPKLNIPIIDINTATVSDWEALPGIGPVLANRIVKYRDKLGGFTQLAQVQKTYGISDSLFNQLAPYLQLNSLEAIKIPSTQAADSVNKKPNINKATVAQLMAVSVPEEIAKAIVLYRKQYGPYERITDLKKIVFISEPVFEQIAPKLQVQ
ncbi:MAG: DNA uptake protein and related DNA-binding protein [Chitinophagaceae bacterium]|nr:MAG: DNA uptake protein and related DNA-binding [Chitinophagaceae bacterium]TXT28804.1 MAG: DNA uptake protein and related DNA-binding protein [Chitinophagaceae bacterium]